MQLERIQREATNKVMNAPLNVAEDAMEAEVVQEEVATEAVAKEKTRRKVIIVSNTTGSIFGKNVQLTGTALQIKQAEEKMVVMAAAAEEAVAEDTEISKVSITNNIIRMSSICHYLLHQVLYPICRVVRTLWEDQNKLSILNTVAVSLNP